MDVICGKDIEMAQIEKNQMLEIDNLFCFRGKVNPTEIEMVGKELEQVIQSAGAQKVGNPITATFAMDANLLDVEIMIPVNQKMESTEKFRYKNKLKVVNAVRARHTGNPAGLQQTCEELNQYIINNQLTPITVGYNVTKHMDVTDMNSAEIDVYVGISPNIL